MIVKELLNPRSILIVGGSNDTSKPGGKVLQNIIAKNYKGKLYVMNPKDKLIQGIPTIAGTDELETAELAIIAVAAKYIPDLMENLASEHNTKAFIILSAGFSEMGAEGKILEDKICSIADKYSASLLGPNCIGLMTPSYFGVFAGPTPKLDPKGVDFVSGSGATACFILETAIPMGISFASVFSVGNSAQIGVEDVLEYWDTSFNPETSSRVKIIYIEKISKPKSFLYSCQSLIKKGCYIAGIKAGTTEAGGRAVSSHTGALAGSDTPVDALFRKAGIIRCYGREELAYVAGLLTYKQMNGKNLAVVTHAGGPGVMATDTLSKGGLSVPPIIGKYADNLLSKLNYGSSVANPIDFLATGTAEHLDMILDYIDKKFENIDGSVVIFGTPGLFDVTPVYEVMLSHIQNGKKPVYPVMPSVVEARAAVDWFLSQGGVFFQDEVRMSEALSKIHQTPKPLQSEKFPNIDLKRIREVIDNSGEGYLGPKGIYSLLEAVNIPLAPSEVVYSTEAVLEASVKLEYPMVAKAVGPIHKTDVGGVILDIRNDVDLIRSYEKLMKIKSTTCVQLQKMMPSGLELFAGATLETEFGHTILFGLGGTMIEVLKDYAYGLAPLCESETIDMIHNLKSYKLIQGIRGSEGTDEILFAKIICNLSALLEAAPEIEEIDLNPLIAYKNKIICVDARIKLKKL